MRVWTSCLGSGAFLLLAFSFFSNSARAYQAGVVFLGTDPVTLNQTPFVASAISSLGVDAAGNQYYADVSGKVIERDCTGATTTLTSGLKNPLITVDFRGNVFVADTGNDRVLKIGAGYKHPVSTLAAAASLRAIAVDTADNVFFLSGDALVKVPNGGAPSPVANVPGASLLAFGPGVNNTRRLYIVSRQADTNYAYFYSYGSAGPGTLGGPVADFLPAVQSGTISSFVVDAHGNAVVVHEGNGNAQVILGTTSGFESTIYSSQLAATPIALDDNGSVYFLDSAGLEQIQLGAVNFGTCRVPDHGAPCSDVHFPYSFLNLHFGGPADVTFQPDNPTGNFQLPSGLSPADFDNAGIIPIYFFPGDSGLLTGTLTVTDRDNKKLTIPLYGFGIVPYVAYYDPAPDLRNQSGNSDPVDIVIAQRCSSTALENSPICGANLVMDGATGEIVASGPLIQTQVVVSGLKNPRKFAVDGDENFYVTQAGVAGVLVVAADGSEKQIATDLADPIGVTLDAAHNLYVTNGDDIVRVEPDGAESLFLTPEMDGGFKSALSVATDYQGNLYAGFASSPYYDRGAILKIAPTGAFEALHVNVLQPAALSAARNGVLYFTDTSSGTLNVYSSNRIQKGLAFGLKNPSGVAVVAAGYISIADSGLGTVLNLYQGLPSTRNYGRVAVGSSSTRTLTVVNVGTDPTPSYGVVEVQPQSQCSTDYLPKQQTSYNTSLGELLNVPFTFQPQTIGPTACEIDLYDENDYLDESPTPFELNGTGTAAAGAPGFSLTPTPNPVIGRPITVQVAALKPDLSLNTDFNDVVQITYSGAGSGSLSVVLTKGVGAFPLTPSAVGVYAFVLSTKEVTTRINMSVGKAKSHLALSGAFHSSASGPVLTASVAVTGDYGIAPPSNSYVLLDLDGKYFDSFFFMSGTGTYTSQAIAGLAPGNHTLTADYTGPGSNLLPSERTITLIWGGS